MIRITGTRNNGNLIGECDQNLMHEGVIRRIGYDELTYTKVDNGDGTWALTTSYGDQVISCGTVNTDYEFVAAKQYKQGEEMTVEVIDWSPL